MNKFLHCHFFLLCLLFINAGSLAQTIRINEFMALNSTTIQDPDYHNYADWIELYNPANSPVSLTGFSITDDITQPQKFTLTAAITIPANGYLLLWADDRNGGTHTNFKLSGDGEFIGLYAPSGAVVDTITFAAQLTDISFGRYPNGGSGWFQFSPATPGTANQNNAIYKKLSPPLVSRESGFFSQSFTVTLSHPEVGAEIRYTRDGRIPTTTDPIYASPLSIDSTSVLRVKAFKSGFLSSDPKSFSYFINEPTSLPVFSIVTDPVNFFSDSTGIYVIGTKGITAHCSTAPRNWNQNWERPVDLELFEVNRAEGFKTSCGVKIYGGCSRLYDMKSLAFYFRGEYGADKLRYRLFPDIPVTEYDVFVLRSSGQDWWRTMFRDGMIQTLLERGMKLDFQKYRPSIVFLNGRYWGIHNIREKLDEHYINEHYGIDPDSVEIIEVNKGISAGQGDTTAYTAMINFLSTNNMSLPANYQYIKSICDIDEYIDYYCAEIYAANGDFPGANIKLWRTYAAGWKWRWMIYDLDFCFGGNSQGLTTTNTLSQVTATNGSAWPNPPWSTIMFRKLLENSEFKNEFIQRFAVHASITFEPNYVLRVIDSIKVLIAAEIPRHKARWAKSISLGNDWNVNVQLMRDFATTRMGNAVGHFNSKFGLSGICTLAVQYSREQGKVRLQNIELPRDTGSYTLFRNMSFRVTASALPGYRFVRWEGISSDTLPEMKLALSANATLRAVFEPAPIIITTPVINEINYNSAQVFDTEDWVELYNPGNVDISLGGWKLQGNNSAVFYTFPSVCTIGAKKYLVICRDTARFRALNPTVNVLGNLPFGLSSNGERLLLSDAQNLPVDEVRYETTGAWTSLPNGSGATLSLIDPQKDNNLPQHWAASKRFGTPGKLNDVYFSVDVEPSISPVSFELFQNFPNPFNPETTIMYHLPVDADVTLEVFSMLGQSVGVLANGFQKAGRYECTFRANDLSSGIYFYQLRANKFHSVKKLVVVK